MLACDLCGNGNAEVLERKHELNYLKCKHCGFVFADTTEFDFSTFNEEMVEHMQDKHIGKSDSARHQRAYQALLNEFAPYRKTGRLLEIGCSTGSFLELARQNGWQEIGVEPVESSARYAGEKLGLNVHTGTLETVELEPASVDVVYSNAVIEHIEHPSEVVRQAFRILRPGGLFYADTVNLDSYTWRILGPRWKLFDPRMHLSLFTPATLSACCEKNGFKVVKTTSHGVRFHATRADRPRGLARIVDELKKTPYSLAARRTMKGDNMAVYAEKPA